MGLIDLFFTGIFLGTWSAYKILVQENKQQSKLRQFHIVSTANSTLNSGSNYIPWQRITGKYKKLDETTVTAVLRALTDVRHTWLLKYPLPSAWQHLSYADCLEVKREYYQNSSVLDCVTQCSQSTAHLCEQFLQVQQIGLVTLGPLRCV